MRGVGVVLVLLLRVILGGAEDGAAGGCAKRVASTVGGMQRESAVDLKADCGPSVSERIGMGRSTV